MTFRQVLLSLFSFFLFLFIPINPVLAAGEFSSSYDVTYDVDATGVTSVTEKISLKNLTDRFYASSFTLSIVASSVFEVSAFDSSGTLDFTVEPKQEDFLKQKITVNFPQQFSGIDKEYKWTLKFKSKDFASAHGKIWQVSVPKIVPSDDLASYDLTVSVPVTFGDPSLILPEPDSTSETNGKLNLNFTKEQMQRSGILATFGKTQVFNFNLTYDLENSSILPTVLRISLPSNRSNQKVIINNIIPAPENVTSDLDGNYVAIFKLDKLQKMRVIVSGSVMLSFDKLNEQPPITNNQVLTLTTSSKHWEKDSPIIRAKLSEIFKNGEPSQVGDKARLIYNYVVNTLKFNDKRYEQGNFARLGALTALTNYNNALGSEFSDLFITLSRAANIPARSLVGFAYSSSSLIRPPSYSKALHVWAEYYDPNLGWVMVDPTWESTSGGIDYFSRFDLDHVVIASRGQSSSDLKVPDSVNFQFADQEIELTPDLYATLDIPPVIYGAVPSKGKVTITNKGMGEFGGSSILIEASKIRLIFSKELPSTQNSFSLPLIPPGGHIDFEFDLRSDSLLQRYEDNIVIVIGSKKFEKSIAVLPFFNAWLFPWIVLGTTALMVLIYILAIFFHIKRIKKKSKKRAKLKK